jgi:hypothetical protein
LGRLRGKGGVLGTIALGGAALATGADVSVTKEDVALPGLDPIKKHFGGYFDMDNKESSDKKAQRMNRFATEGETISQERAMDYFVNKGLTPEQAAGIVGNLMQESRLKSDAYNAKEGAYGIAQWRNDRLDGLKQFAASQGKEISDINTQMDYILLELGTTQKQAGQMLLASKTPQEAAFNFGKYYERPKTVEHTRIAYAEQAYSKRNKDLSSTTSVSTAKSTGDLINQSSFDNNIKKSLGRGEEVVVINNNSQTNNNQQTPGGGSTASPWNENAYKIFAERSIGF